MVFVTATDNNFVPGVLTLMVSLWLHHDDKNVEIFVLDQGISSDNLQIIHQLGEQLKINCQVLSISDEHYNDLPTMNHWTLAMYARLMIPSLIGERYNKVIYLDSDVLVVDNLKALWDIDLNNYPMAAVIDGFIPALEISIAQVKIDTYINSGVIVFNLVPWRAEGIAHQIIDFIRSNKDRIVSPDQTAINAILKDRILFIDRKWNYFAKEYFAFSSSIKPSIIHFVGKNKPWLYKDTEFGRLYDFYQSFLPNKMTTLTKKSHWDFRRYRKTILGLIGLRKKYWRPLLKKDRLSKVENQKINEARILFDKKMNRQN